MKKFYKSLLTFLTLFLLGYTSIYAQCILFPGNLVFSGVNLEDDGVNGATQNDRFSFVLLQEVSENFEIYFTDLGWTASNSFQTPDKALTDGVIKWTAPAGGVQSGTQITIDAKYNLSASLGTIVGVRATPNDANIYLNLGNSGDQLFAFTGSIQNPVFIAGININQNWFSLPSDKLTSSESALPASLNTANVQNVSLLSAFSNGFTDAVISGDSFNGLFSDIVSEFNQDSNWTFDEKYLPNSRATGFQLPKTLSFSVTPFNFLNNPTGTNSITYGVNTQFTVSKVDSRNITSYQWQVSTNGGSVYFDLDDSGIYSGTTSATLELSKPEVSNSNYRYRVKAVDACGNEAISNHLVLTVNPRSLTVNLIGTIEKKFDGNTQATIANENLELTGSLGEDDVAIVNPGSGIYANAAVGTAILVTVNDLTITGVNANNYSLSSTSAAANVGIITLAEVTGVTLDDQSFVFDGNEKTLAISGELPEGTSVAYSNNGRTSVGNQQVTATISGANFTTLVLNAELTITSATITGITFENGSFVFDGTEKTIEITGTLPNGTSVAYANNTLTNAGTQQATATISGDNYSELVLNAELTITPATITGITFENGSFVFDGTEKTIEITGTLPNGTSVAYANNTLTNAGTQQATATISGDNYTTLVLTADLTITPATITGITFENGSFVFDGTEKIIEITGTLPNGTSVAYANNTRTNAGTQQATATISGDNYSELVLNAEVTITPATIAGITFENGTFVFDESEKTIEITGTLPNGTSVAYANNTRTNAGTQQATATISGDNYSELVLNAELTITPATIAGITFENGTFVYDGTEKIIEITGTLPNGASVAYENNGRTNVGNQQVTATISGDNYTTLVLTAELTITPATITGITFEDGSFVFDESEKTIEITGTLPNGASVAYANNTRTNTGTQQATATITGANYTTLVLTAELTITPATITGITFEDGSFVFDESEKAIEITGTLPNGTSVAYANNTRTNTGTQQATATITGANYTTLVLTAELEITPATITGITFEDGSFIFDESEKAIEISGTLPNGASVAYENNGRTNVGNQQVTATISGDNYSELVLNAELTITPATITGITFENGSFVFDESEKTIEITGTLPNGTSVAYANNTRTNTGTQQATATISGDNYSELVLTAELEITPATITGITFEDGSFVFDGTEKTIEISGTLPNGASVAYANNTRTNVGTQQATATISGDNYSELVLNAELTITPATITGITFEDGSFVFDESEKTIEIVGTLPNGTFVAYENNGRTNVGNQQVTATISGDNYSELVLTAELEITPATITGITFEDGSFVFDGTEKTIEISGTLPNGTSVAYTDNTRTNAGTQQATATISGDNYSELVLNAELTITPATITGITFENGTFVFDESEKTIEISGTLPNGTSVSYANNTRTNAGTQQATATISGDNYSELVLNAELTITPATITGITFEDGSFVFDESEKAIEISGTLPNGTSVAYTDNTRTNTGTQQATATISGDNYTTLVLTAELEITPATITEITFEDGSFVFDGTEKTIEITGTLPNGTSVSYANNTRTNAGTQQATATISGDNYTTLVLTADLTITPATIAGITFEDRSFVFDESEKTIEIGGTLPNGTFVAYTDNTRTNVGTQQATATISGDNYSELVLTAELEITPATITGITFEDGSFIFDESEKTIEITGTLPNGTSVAYENNGRTNVGNQQVTATISGANYTTLVLNAELTITPATITGITFEDRSFVFDESEKTIEIGGTLPNGTFVAYTDNTRTNVGTQQATATISGDNYSELVLTAELEITPATITGITFEDGSFVFDESEKTIEITGTLPNGTSVSYANNTRTNAGTQQATATITGTNYTTLVLTADLEITPATITGITFENGTYVFDGTEKAIEISGTLPNGTSVSYANNTRTNAGTQQATATISGDNYTTLVLTAELEITPATITEITFEDGSFVFDGTEKTIEITGTLPNGTSVSYANNTRTNAGTQQATATITGTNYTTLVLTADLEITPATITGITFENGTYVFDGTEKAIEISGTLPNGTSVSYANNTRTNAGTQQATATISGDNYTTLVLTAELTITPVTITGITFEDGSFVFDESEKAIEITGTLPNGASVSYANNTRTNAGTQQATATILGDNYSELVLTAELEITPATITGITLEDGSFVFDESEKAIEISGTLPNGASVAYANNTRTNTGTQQATATITGANYTTLVLTAELEITPATITGITFEDGSFIFDESEKAIEISGTLPNGASVAYENNGRTNVGNQQVTATISGDNYTTLVLFAELTISPATITGITFEDGSFVFDESEKAIEITGTLPNGASVAYENNGRTNVGNQQVTATISGDNYSELVLTAELEITPATITGITFEDGSFVFDESEKAIEISGTLPNGTSVSYANNTRTNAGTQQATATITGTNYTTLVLTADLEITPATITGITFEDGSFIFDESEKTIEITGTLPNGTSVAYENNGRTNIGNQQVTARITGSNFNDLVLTADLEITPATITGITFEDGSFVFDGTEKTIEISGTLPNGTSVAYTDNTRTNVGAQQATATISGDNYSELVLTAELEITPATITGITFEDGTFVFDESEKTIEITGTLPNGASVAYENNGRTNVGNQQVTARITGSNFNDLVLTAELEITPATITGITFEDGSFVFDGTEKTIEISGTLPNGASVAYANNTRTNTGTQQATATITGANYTTLVLTAELTITPATITGITFENGTFVFDESEKTIEITGTLPNGTSVAYANNTRTNAGTQQATATISGDNYTTLVLTAELTITPATITGITFENGSFVFDGTEKTIEITGTLPNGTSVAYANNTRTNAGTQQATATISGDNYSELVLNAELTITPATITGITFENGTFVFDESEKTIEITGTLPNGTSVAYANNTRTNAGTQQATATITGTNYTTLVLTADLEITPATITGITFEDGSFIFDESEKTIEITGTLPNGTSVAYENNSRTNVGTQKATATISGDNYTTLVLTAELTITPATITGITFEDGSFVFDESEKAIEISGTLPNGASVAYANNTRKNAGTQQATATISGANFTTLVLNAELTITPATITGITFEDGSFVFDESEKTIEITGTLPNGTSVAYTDNTRTNVGAQQATATISGDNYTTLVLTADLTITPATITGITFEDGSFVFDESEKTIEITGTLPNGASVAYENNGRTNVGNQQVTATISGDNYTTLVLNAELTITPATITGITFEDGSFIFDESEKTIEITGTLPNGTSVAYENNGRTNVGNQQVTATISGANYTTLVLTAELEITPATITGITFKDGNFVFDGTEKIIEITGTLPNGASVTYSNNTRTNAGTQQATATISGYNYTTLVLYAELTISPATITGFTFEDGSFVFDGTEKTIEISGTLPAGASVAYENNGRTNVGNQQVTARITGSNFDDFVLTADLEITPATIRGITFEDGNFVFDGTEKTLEISGTLPNGVSVAYTDNTRTNVGAQQATATISGDNYTTLVLNAELTISPATITGFTFEDGSFVFDGTEKTIEISGTLPAGASVAYENNGRTNVGNQQVTARITGSNFDDFVLTADLEITPATIRGITFEDGNFVFDGTEKTLEISGTLPNGASVAYANNTRTNVGTQNVTAIVTGTNYIGLTLMAELEVTPATLTLTVTPEQGKIYGETDPILSYTVSGFAGEDDESILSGQLVRVAGEDVGKYLIEQGSLSISPNYIINFVSADFEIVKKALTIQANDKSKIYGSANPVFTLTYSGLVNGDEKVSIEPSISSTATATSSVGTYPIILLGGSDMNYDIKLVSGKLEVTAASLTLVADDQSKVYDLEDPEFTYTVTGLIGKDQLSGSLSRVSGEDVGKYDITLGSLTGGDNYQITLISAQLEIIPTSIKEIFEIGTLDMNWGAVSDLPNSVALMATNGRPYFLDVTWNELPLNRFRRGTYDLVGEVIQTSWLKNPENLKAELQVRVLPKPLPQDILLSNNTFEGAKSNQEVAIGSLTVLDSIDNIHVLGVPYDLEDNRYFKVINDVLYWSSENPAGGRTTFKVVVRVTDRDLNTLDKVFTIERSRQSVASIEVFNTFTPNGDGMNDTWGVPDLRYYRNVRIQIFERGGERMFYTEDPDIRWDGTFNGRELPIGTYYWTIEVGETGEVRKGMLNLLRK